LVFNEPLQQPIDLAGFFNMRQMPWKPRPGLPPPASRYDAEPMAEELGPTLDRLWQVIHSRRSADPQSSYTARLFARGRAKIAQKLGEEAIEAVIEGVGDNSSALVGESADLLYHLLVLWAAAGVSPADVAAELTRREGTSGVEEKRGRANL
jgi:phosphoribosyl-ATP pyrophosphohydrolase